MHLFPESGFDRSAATPVFAGVLVSWFFTETFGWVFAGLVVPGYLATLFLLEPRSAMVDVLERCSPTSRATAYVRTAPRTSTIAERGSSRNSVAR